MQYYQTKAGKIPGTDFREVNGKAMEIFDVIKNRSKRKPHIRSAYFRKQKVFLDFFWNHIHTNKNPRDRLRRLKYFEAALKLIRESRLSPESKENPNKSGEILHRFAGKTKEGDVFMVQIKEFKKNSQKYFISVFPI